MANPQLTQKAMALSALSGNPHNQNIINDIQLSQTATNQLNTLTGPGYSGGIQIGKVGGGTSTSNNVITIDPNNLPTAQSSQAQVASFVTMFAGHEAGHATQPGGIPQI